MKMVTTFAVLIALVSLTDQDCLSYPKQMAVFDKKNKGLDMLVVGMFPMFKEDKHINPTSVLLTEALKYHVERVQQKIPELKKNISFSVVIFDTSCENYTTTQILLEVLLNLTILNESPKIYTVLTSTNNEQLLNTINILQADGIPAMMIVTNSSQKYYVPKADYRLQYLQSKADLSRVNLITNLLERDVLSYITIFSDLSYFGTHGRSLLESKFKAKNICVAHKFHLPKGLSSYQRITAQIQFDKKMQVFVVWSEESEKVIELLTQLHAEDVKNKVWILSYEVNITKLSADIVASNSIITISQQNSKTDRNKDDFIKYYGNLNYSDNPWLKFYVDHMPNRMEEIRSIKQLHTQREVATLEQIIYRATESMWKALKVIKNLLRKEEESDNRILAGKTYKRIFTVFEFNKGNTAKFNVKLSLVQDKHVVSVLLTRKNTPNITTVCDSPCLSGYQPVYANKLVRCCWDCVKCQPQFYKNVTGQNKCQKCPAGMSSDYNRTTCIIYTKIYQKATLLESALILAFGTISALLSLFFFAVFHRFKGTPIVRASDSIKTFIQLVSHTFLSVLLFSFAVSQSQIICSLQPFLFGSFMTITASITFIKTRKLLLIFQAKTRLSHHHITLTKVIAASTVIFLVAIQFTISFCLFLFFPHRHSHILDYEAITDHLECNNQNHFIVQLIYIKSLSMLCLWQAFKARKLPENFNETKYIGVAVLMSEVFLLAYVVKTESNIVTNATLLFCANISLTLIMYGHRVFIILFQPHKNTSTVFRNKIMNRIKRDVETRTATVSSDVASGVF